MLTWIEALYSTVTEVLGPFTPGKYVLEVGSGAGGLVALAALQSAARFVCSDGSPAALALLETNVSRIAQYVHGFPCFFNDPVWLSMYLQPTEV